METETKLLKIDVKKVVITLALVLFTAAAVGGGVYYVLNQNFKKEREANEQALNVLRDQLKKDQEKVNTVTVDKDPDSKTYTDSTYNFSFKYPNGMTVALSKSNTANNYSVLINKKDNVNSDGTVKGDVSSAFLTVKDVETISSWTDATIESPSGAILGRYEKSTTPFGYTYYAYEFKKGDKYYYFRMNNYSETLMSLPEFTKMVNTITFN